MKQKVDQTIRMTMTQSQLGIWFECLEPVEGRSYDLPYLFELGARTDGEMKRLARALERTVLAHPGLLARVAPEEGIPALEMEAHPAFRADIEKRRFAGSGDGADYPALRPGRKTGAPHRPAGPAERVPALSDAGGGVPLHQHASPHFGRSKPGRVF